MKRTVINIFLSGFIHSLSSFSLAIVLIRTLGSNMRIIVVMPQHYLPFGYARPKGSERNEIHREKRNQ